MKEESWRGGPDRPPAPGTVLDSSDVPVHNPDAPNFQPPPPRVEAWLTARYALTGPWPRVIAQAAGLGCE